MISCEMHNVAIMKILILGQVNLLLVSQLRVDSQLC